MMKATNLDDEEKKRYLREHFYYEVKMLDFAAAKLAEFAPTDIWNRNMALETFLLHARNLKEFFYYKPCKPYLRAYDFVENETEWDRDKPAEKTHWIKEVEGRADKELVHLTHGRIYGTPPEKKWDYGTIQRDFLKVVKHFLDHLPEKYIDERLRKIKEMCVHVATSTRKQIGLSTPAGTTTAVSIATCLEDNSNYSRYPHIGRP